MREAAGEGGRKSQREKVKGKKSIVRFFKGGQRGEKKKGGTGTVPPEPAQTQSIE